MSEYQYYEFQAVDRRLSAKEMEELRALSSRATITPSSFVNEYSYGDFRGSPEKLMEKHFDAHLYVANWGTHRLMLRVPRRLLDEEVAQPYCVGALAEIRRATRTSEFVILEWRTPDEERGDGWEQGEGWLASLLPLRDELLAGDRRALYLGWLVCAQGGELPDDELEPEVPPGLARLSPSLDRFADFLRIDPALIEVAAEAAPEEDRRVRKGSGGPPRRTVAALLAAARERAEANQRAEEVREAKARAAREKKAALARKKRLDALAENEKSAWRSVEERIAKLDHDAAVSLLVDLRDLAVAKGRWSAFLERLTALRARHKSRMALLRRINAAGLRERMDG